MDLSSSNKVNFHFVCTNYGSSKDGIGHYTSKIVDELRKNNSIKINTYSATTHNLSKVRLFFSLKMSLELLRLRSAIHRNSHINYIILEYPFVEYNPLFLLILLSIKSKLNSNSNIVVSLHEYSRTKFFRKMFIKLLIPISNIVLFTKVEDIKPFVNEKITFKKRIIPANIEPLHRKKIEHTEFMNICFFGIINFETKEIKNMIQGWENYLNSCLENKITFHFITSSLNSEIKNNKRFNYHFDLEDDQVSNLLHKMQFMILPLKPRISANNGSLSVCCIHECLPIGIFDDEYFDENLGIRMRNYSIEEFVSVYESINNFEFNTIIKLSNTAYQHGKKMSVSNSAKSYLELFDL